MVKKGHLCWKVFGENEHKMRYHECSKILGKKM